MIDAAVSGDLGVGTGNADSRDASLFKDSAAGHGDTGTIGAQNDGNITLHQLCCCRGAVLSGSTVINDLQLDLIGLAANLNSGLHIVCILHTQNLLLTACTVIAGLRLKNTDLDDLIAAFALLCFAAATCDQAQRHNQCQYKCQILFHPNFLLLYRFRFLESNAHGMHFTFFIYIFQYS